MSNIGIAANLFQPSGKCLKCRHWNPATKDFMGNGTDGHCRLAYCKNSRPERRNKKKERQRGIGMTVTVFIVLIMTIFWMLLQFILPGLNDTLCIIFYYLTMCLLGMWCFYYIGVVMAEMR